MLMKKAMMKQTLAKGFVQRFAAWRSGGFLPQMFIRSTHFKYSTNVSTKHVTRHYAKPLLAAVFLVIKKAVPKIERLDLLCLIK